MQHIHHIIPKHMGGTDDISNLISLTREEHALAHKLLYEKYGKKEDLGAYYLLMGQTDEAMKICSTLGGRVQGKKNAESGHMKQIQSELNHSVIGKKGAEVCKEKGVNAFFDPDLRIAICKKGGSTQGKINASSGHCKTIANKYWNDVKTGKIQRTKKYWIYNKETNHSMLISESEEIPFGYQKGRKIV